MARIHPMLIQISAGDTRPISRQIVDAVRLKIATGELADGAQVPSVRGLAQQLGVNPNTVAKAYAELTAGGWLDARHGLGLYVAPARQRLSDEERDRRLDDAVQRFVHDVVAIGCVPERALDRVATELQQLKPRKIA